MDENIRLPKAIQRQVAEADQLVEEINKELSGESQPIINPPLEAPPEQIQPEVEDTPELESPQVPTPSVVEKPKEEDAAYWKQRFQTVQGMYDADVGKVRNKAKEVELINQQLLDEIEESKKQKNLSLPEIPPITDKDKEVFGPELVELIERAAESKVRPVLIENEKLKSEVKELKNNLGNVNERQGVSDKDRLIMKLSSLVPNWEKTNTDPGFLTWLAEEDSVYGLPRRIALDTAFDRLEVERVANIFKAYQSMHAAPTPAEVTKAKTTKELQRQISPARTNSGNNQPIVNPLDTHQWTQKEIEQFYKEVRTGRYTDEEANAMEASIFRAVGEGRVR